MVLLWQNSESADTPLQRCRGGTARAEGEENGEGEMLGQGAGMTEEGESSE